MLCSLYVGRRGMSVLHMFSRVIDLVKDVLMATWVVSLVEKFCVVRTWSNVSLFWHILHLSMVFSPN